MQREFTIGKNENAVRSFALSDLALKILLEHQTRNGNPSFFIFCLKDIWIRPVVFYKRWVKYRDYWKLGNVTPYGLRYTFVSIVKPLPEGMIKPLVGHSVNMNTYKIYAHEVNVEAMPQLSLYKMNSAHQICREILSA